MSCQQKDFLAGHRGLQVDTPRDREPNPGPSSRAVAGGSSGWARTPDPATEGLKPNPSLCSQSHSLSMEASQQTPAAELQHGLPGIAPVSKGQILPLELFCNDTCPQEQNG